ncbi:MAG TPA: transporter, partial [Chitinophagaceae bacterium]|nr:transporter [Chitinophagaceae bacterium]
MSTSKKHHAASGSSDSTGFGANSSYNAGRFVNKNGIANVVKTGAGIMERHSIYHTLLESSRLKFLLSIFSFFILINILFAF